MGENTHSGVYFDSLLHSSVNFSAIGTSHNYILCLHLARGFYLQGWQGHSVTPPKKKTASFLGNNNKERTLKLIYLKKSQSPHPYFFIKQNCPDRVFLSFWVNSLNWLKNRWSFYIYHLNKHGKYRNNPHGIPGVTFPSLQLVTWFWGNGGFRKRIY